MHVTKLLILIYPFVLFIGQASAAEDVTAPNAAEYREEAASLRNEAARYRAEADRHRHRGPGQDGYSTAKHAQRMAVTYEKAARDAQAIAQALSK